MLHRQAHHVTDLFNLECDPRVLLISCLIGRLSPCQDKAPRRGTLNYLSDQDEGPLFVEASMLPPGADLPVGHVRMLPGTSLSAQDR